MSFFAKIWAWIKDWFNHVETMPVLPPGWNLQFSKNVPAQMTSAGDGTYYFDFPQQDGVHYVLEPIDQLTLGKTITMKFAIVGVGKLIPVDGDPTARIRLMIQQKDDTLAQPDKRWWSAPLELKNPGEYTLTTQLEFVQWIGIGGGLPTAGAAGFANCVANIANVGFSFGGWSAGHGVYASGPSRFILRSFTIS